MGFTLASSTGFLQRFFSLGNDFYDTSWCSWKWFSLKVADIGRLKPQNMGLQKLVTWEVQCSLGVQIFEHTEHTLTLNPIRL